VLVLTTFDIDEYVYDALEAGASGFLLKDADPDDIVDAIKVVAQGDALIQPSVMKRLVETFVAARPRGGGGQAAGEARKAALASLTDREREILQLVARGLSNDEIAEHLFISAATVKTHLARVMGKTGTHDRAGLVVFAYETGLVKPLSS
jgi:DNA-binding NarL/FixJ family response regulator